MQTFSDEQTEWQALINGVTPDGQLVVQLTDGSMQRYTHGMVTVSYTHLDVYKRQIDQLPQIAFFNVIRALVTFFSHNVIHTIGNSVYLNI